MNLSYTVISGVIFGVIALAQALRALAGSPVQVGDCEIPAWASGVAAFIAAALCAWAFRSKR
jgi:hypothetical protein